MEKKTVSKFCALEDVSIDYGGATWRAKIMRTAAARIFKEFRETGRNDRQAVKCLERARVLEKIADSLRANYEKKTEKKEND